MAEKRKESKRTGDEIMITKLNAYYCTLCGNIWIDNGYTPYVKCEQCGAKESRSVAGALNELQEDSL